MPDNSNLLKRRYENAKEQIRILNEKRARLTNKVSAKSQSSSGTIPGNIQYVGKPGWNKLPRRLSGEVSAVKILESYNRQTISSCSDSNNAIEKDLFVADLDWLSGPEDSNNKESFINSFLTIECFGGSARLTRALSDIGFDATSIDWIRNKSRPVGSSILLDLTSEYGRVILHKALRSGRVVYLHLAPPCGTASLARSIPMGEKPAGRKFVAPVPLRSAEFPDGFPWLEGADLLRVKQANQLYEATAAAVMIADSLGIAWSIENPRSSWFWSTSWIKDLISTLKAAGREALWAEFQNCAFGGARPKWSAFLHNVPLLMELQEQGVCQGNHEHKAWGFSEGTGFATAEEAAYPVQLCVKIADIIRRHLQTQGLAPSPVSKVPIPTATGIQAAEAGKQARGHKAPRLISEFSGTKKFLFKVGGSEHVIEGQTLRAPVRTIDDVIPEGSKIVRTTAESGGVRAVWANIPWDKEGFLQAARLAVHPVDSTGFLDPKIYANIFWILCSGPDEVLAVRAAQLDKLRTWAKSLENEERAVHSALPAVSEKILSRKKILLFDKVLRYINHGDLKVAGRVATGFQLSGALEISGVFEARVPKNPNPVSKQDLLKASKWSRHVIAATVGPSGDEAMDQEIFQITRDEVASGWLTGPISTDELDRKYNSAWLAARRFGVRQGTKGKVRPIDDFTAHGQNSTVSTSETIPLGGVDAIISLARWLVGAVGDDRTVKLPNGSGGFLEGTLHSSWTISSARSIMGRCLDLKSAYKQVLREKADSALSVVSVWNPHSGKVELYETESLPFGSTGSVYGFNRCSFALRQIFVHMFRMTCTSFFDDYPFLEFQCLAEQTATMSVEILDILGWDVSLDKLQKFSMTFEAVGVEFDLQGLPTRGSIVCKNTTQRKLAITSDITGFLESGFMSTHEAATLRGRMQYGEAQHWGRVLSLSSKHLSIRANGGGCGAVIGELADALIIAKWLINFAAPRVLHPWSVEPCNLVFVDGAAEPIIGTTRQKVSIGGVLFSHRLKAPQFWGIELSDEVVAHWQSDGSKQVIGQAELLPVWVSKRVWSQLLAHARNLFFMDNEGARESLIRNFSPSWTSREIILRIKILDIKSSSLDWYSRVPTRANYSDGPSRLNFSDMKAIGAEQVPISQPRLCDITGANILSLLRAEQST